MKNKNSFTLVEIMTTISIIGLLASIIVVTFNQQREKARISKATQFSKMIYHAIGSEAAGLWNFDEVYVYPSTRKPRFLRRG